MRLLKLFPSSQTPKSEPEQDLPQPLPLPVAVAYLTSPDADELSPELSDEFGTNPSPAALQELAARFGCGLKFDQISPHAAEDLELPFAIIAQGGAYIVTSISGETWDITGHTGEANLSPTAFLQEGKLTVITYTDEAMDAAQNEASSPKTLLRWFAARLWETRRRDLFLLGLAAGLSNLCLVALPIFIMSVYDRVIPYSAFESLQTLVIGIMIILGLDLGLRFSRLKFVDAIGLKLSAALNTVIYKRLLRLQLAKKPSSPALLTSAQSDLEAISLLFPEFLIGVSVDLGFTLLVLMAIIAIGGPVVLGPMFGMVAVAITVVLTARSLTKSSAETSVLRQRTAAQMAETYDCLTTVKATGAAPQLLSSYERLQGQLALKNHETRHRLRFASSAVQVIVQLTIVMTMCLGVMRISQGAMSIGSLAAITMLVSRAIGPVAQVTDQVLRLNALTALVTKAFDVVNTPEAEGGETDGAARRPFTGKLSLRGVTVRYTDDAPAALDRLTLEIPPGQHLGLVGKNGSGKSTLLNLFPRIITPDHGSYLIDEADARQFAATVLRQKIAFAPQESVLFNASLRENICLGHEKVDEDAFQRACEAAGVDRIAGTHPKGYSLIVGPRGEHLSGGERQAVGLARALLTEKPILILDEPTAQMDHTLEGHVISRLQEWTANKTLIVSTHRLRLLSLVTRVIALDAGHIIADGPRDEVLASLGGAPAQRPAQKAS